jgi:5-hydroxyisourate hydrolase
MGRLTTHVLDTTTGRPAAGVVVTLFQLAQSGWTLLKAVTTNADGRTDAPLLADDAFSPATYRLDFDIAEYFRRMQVDLSDPPFFEIAPLRITVADASLHYHVPLLCTPWSYSTYRGS